MRLRPLLVLLVAAFAPVAARASCPSTPATAPLTVNFLGVSTIVVSDGSRAIMVDGFFSRPLALRVAPNQGRINDGLDRAGILRIGGDVAGSGAACLAALLVAQAHHDHGMDAAAVAEATGAMVYGSSSTGQIAAGGGVADGQFQRIGHRDTLPIPPFTVRVIESPHSTGLIPRLVHGTIREPLIPPQSPLAYLDTQNFSFVISHGRHDMLVHPSANFPPRGMGPIEADIVFLSIGDLYGRGEDFAGEYWQNVVLASGAHLVVPIHWDNFLTGIRFDRSGRARPLGPLPLSGYSRVRQWIEALGREDCIQVLFLPAFQAMQVEALVAAAGEYRRQCLAERARRPSIPGRRPLEQR